MTVKSIEEIDLKGKRVFVRVDFNVPLDEEGNILDDTRIRSVLPTLNFALDARAKVIVASHLGRPKGKRNEKYSLRPCGVRLGRLLSKEVRMAPDCVGPQVEALVNEMQNGDVLLLENLRFHQEETDNDAIFAQGLARLADVYVNDGFAVAHRVNASVVAITDFVEACVMGFLMKKELKAFSQVVENPRRPLVAILGGAKVGDKVGAVSHFVDHADKVIIGGAMATTFLKARGIDPKGSLVEEDLVPVAKDILEKALKKGVKFYLPVDCVAAQERNSESPTLIRPVQEIPDGWMALDIGPASVALFSEVIEDARTIVWNGPMGLYEMDSFSRGTFALIRKVASSYAFTVLGGGDLDMAVHRTGEADNISYISTGGGAFVELLSGKTLPAIQALMDCGGAATS
ncbi:MAG: phosphoglycerate kinase [Thermodesulfobacteriota bacterium]|nr:phosphoglycerate kinase [Thermodesulfobacteriota bacterium]